MDGFAPASKGAASTARPGRRRTAPGRASGGIIRQPCPHSTPPGRSALNSNSAPAPAWTP